MVLPLTNQSSLNLYYLLEEYQRFYFPYRTHVTHSSKDVYSLSSQLFIILVFVNSRSIRYGKSKFEVQFWLLKFVFRNYMQKFITIKNCLISLKRNKKIHD